MTDLSKDDYEYLLNLKEEILSQCEICDHSGFVIVKNENKLIATSAECKCMKKFKRYKSYYKARIPKVYWTVTANNFYGDKRALKFTTSYLDNIHNAFQKGLGIFFYGTNGNGKTSLLNIILKEALKNDYTVYYTTLQNILNMIMSTFGSDEEKDNIREFLVDVDMIAIDEIGKEHLKKNQQGSVFGMVEFEELLRHREGKGKINLIASNFRPQQLEAKYGLSISSLFKGSMRAYEVVGIDTRKTIKSPKWKDLLTGKA